MNNIPLKDAASSVSIVKKVLCFIPSMIKKYKRLKLFLKKEGRLIEHLTREVMMISLSDSKKDDFIQIRKFLNDSEYFNIPEQPGTSQEIDRLERDKYSLLIIGYDPDEDFKRQEWKNIFDVVRNKRIPVIIYTFGKQANYTLINDVAGNYSYYSYAQFPLSLTNTLFTTLATFSPDL